MGIRSPVDTGGAPVVFPGSACFVRVAQAAAETVVGGLRPVQVLVFPVKVEAQNMKTITNFSWSVGQVVVASHDLVFSEWHDLHQALCTHARDRGAIFKPVLCCLGAETRSDQQEQRDKDSTLCVAQIDQP